MGSLIWVPTIAATFPLGVRCLFFLCYCIRPAVKGNTRFFFFSIYS